MHKNNCAQSIPQTGLQAFLFEPFINVTIGAVRFASINMAVSLRSAWCAYFISTRAQIPAHIFSLIFFSYEKEILYSERFLFFSLLRRRRRKKKKYIFFFHIIEGEKEKRKEINRMGCPGIYYTQALQYFAHALAYDKDKKLARQLADEKDDKKLEDYIQSQRANFPEKEFYFLAGRTFQKVFDEAEQEGVDPMNASIAGVDLFCDFVGVEG